MITSKTNNTIITTKGENVCNLDINYDMLAPEHVKRVKLFHKKAMFGDKQL